MFDMCGHGNIAMTCPSCRRVSIPAAPAPTSLPAQAVQSHNPNIAAGIPAETRAYLQSEWRNILDRAHDRILADMRDPDGHGRRYLTPAEARAKAEAEGIPFA